MRMNRKELREQGSDATGGWVHRLEAVLVLWLVDGMRVRRRTRRNWTGQGGDAVAAAASLL